MVSNVLKTKNDELVVAHAKLVEDFKHLENGSQVVKRELIKLTESHEQLKDSYSKELASFPHLLLIVMMLVLLTLFLVKHLF